MNEIDPDLGNQCIINSDYRNYDGYQKEIGRVENENADLDIEESEVTREYRSQERF